MTADTQRDHTGATPHSDLDIARTATLRPIRDIAATLGVPEDALIPYGRVKAKIDVEALRTVAEGEDIATVPHRATTVLVTAMSPTPAGEGKTTVSVGLGDALNRRGQRTVIALREPSLGPVMGLKGGAAGGGYAQVMPMEDINLHFTGDLHAITATANTLAALIDNHIHQGNTLGIDPRRIVWKRAVDINDRALRHIVVGLGSPIDGVPHEAGFEITAASEIMAVLCLAKDVDDLEERLGNILIGWTYGRTPVFVRDLEVQGALTLLLKEAINPNLVQTLEGTPALIHGGPFANIAHGCSSLRATLAAQRLADVLVTEAGFGADLGAEKFFDIKARLGGFAPDAVVIVATVRALKFHGGKARADLNDEDVDAMVAGTANLERHIGIARSFGLDPVVAINRFTADTDAECDALSAWCTDHSVSYSLTDVWAKGGEGALDLAERVLEKVAQPHDFHQIYDPDEGIVASLNTVATTVYGAQKVEFSDAAMKSLKQIEANGWHRLPVCVAKTPASFTDDPKVLGAPQGHTLHIRDLVPRLGPGFIVALAGNVMTMPGLPKKPAALNMGVNDDGEAVGLF